MEREREGEREREREIPVSVYIMLCLGPTVASFCSYIHVINFYAMIIELYMEYRVPLRVMMYIQCYL